MCNVDAYNHDITLWFSLMHCPFPVIPDVATPSNTNLTSTNMQAISTSAPANLTCQFKKLSSGTSTKTFRTDFSSIPLVRKHHQTWRTKHSTSRISAVYDGSTLISDPVQAEITWEIVVGTLAGVIPFVVAGIEFSKRIVKQRECKVCGGSGLVLRDNKYYFRCPNCGGFLPWQSWRRFFTG